METDIFQIAEIRYGFKLAYIVKKISNTSLTSSVTPREKKLFDYLNLIKSGMKNVAIIGMKFRKI